MSYRPRDVYRGRRKFRVPLAIFLFVVVILLVGGIALFLGLQQYLVYDQEGVSLQLPFLQEEPEGEVDLTASDNFTSVSVEVVYDDTDFSQVDLGGWETLFVTKTRFISYEDAVNAVSLDAAVASASVDGYTGVVLELKNSSGQLAWASTCEMATAYETAGLMDYTETVAALHEQGMTAAAQISCCADELMATRNWTVALQTGSGEPYQDGSGIYWLDPYNRTVRTYLADLMEELAAMGFDEIILADLAHPVTDTPIQYSVTLLTEEDPVTAVCQMGRALVESVAETETAVSVRIDSNVLREGSSDGGQDMDIFWRLFARVYCPTDVADAASDRSLAMETMASGDADIRFVPMCAAVPEGFASYCIFS